MIYCILIITQNTKGNNMTITLMLKRTTIVISTMIAFSQLALAGGVQFTSVCSNKACGYTTKYKTGNGKVSQVVSGYCMHCQKMVTIHFKRGKSTMVTKVWDAKTGNILKLYTCPDCKKPFAEVKKIIFCPKCRQNTISTQGSGKWD